MKMKNLWILALPLLMVNPVSADHSFYAEELQNRWTTEMYFGEGEGELGGADVSGIQQSFHLNDNFALDFGYRNTGEMKTTFFIDGTEKFDQIIKSQAVQSYELGVHADYFIRPSFSLELNSGIQFVEVKNKHAQYSVLYDDLSEKSHSSLTKKDKYSEMYFGFAAKYHFTDTMFASANYHTIDGNDYEDYSIGVGFKY